jgi:hypothetical protein
MRTEGARRGKTKRLTQQPDCLRVNRLSDLQKWILVAASKVKPTESEGAQTFRLYTAQIKAGYYKFSLRKDWMGDRVSLDDLGCKHFNSKEIPNYRAACVAISRAITRLEKRGLVTVLQGRVSHWTAVQLTEAGKSEAQTIDGSLRENGTRRSLNTWFKDARSGHKSKKGKNDRKRFEKWICREEKV